MVRTSIRLSTDFILLMDSSPGFGSCPSDLRALFGLAFAPAPAMDCLSHATENKVVGSLGKRNAVTPPKRGSNSLFATHFRDYFIPLSGCFSPFPHGTIRYRSLNLFSLGWWSTQIRAGFLVSDLTQDSSPCTRVSATGLSPSVAVRSRTFAYVCAIGLSRSYNPLHKCRVWAVPGSLATTTGISYDFFSPATEMFQFAEYTFTA